MSKHTPGPWTVNRYHPDKAKAVVFEIWGGKDGLSSVCKFRPVNSENNRANATLIASAPELLEACKAVNASLVAHGFANTMGGMFYKEALLLAQAITKAEGIL